MTEMNLNNERAPMPALVSVPISNIDNTVSDIVRYSNKQIRKASSGCSCQPPPGSGSLRLRLDCRQPPRWIRRASRRSPRPSCPDARTRPPGPSAPGRSGSRVRPPSSRAMRPTRRAIGRESAEGVPRLAGRAHDGPSAFLDRLDSLALFLFRVARHLRTPNRTGSVQLFVRAPISAIKQCIHRAPQSIQ